MFRKSLKPFVQTVGLNASVEEVSSSVVCPFANLNLIRWRKRRWIPITPSKLFTVRERTHQDPVEYQELKTLYANYRTTLRSVIHYLRSERLAKVAVLTDKSHIDEERLRMESCAGENEKFNETSAKLRAVREKSQLDRKDELQLHALAEMEDQLQLKTNDAREQIRQLQAQSAVFIRPENIQSAIEAALSQRSTFNFAIDLDGNRYVEKLDGSTTVIPSTRSD